jgi:hypothetical protein
MIMKLVTIAITIMMKKGKVKKAWLEVNIVLLRAWAAGQEVLIVVKNNS